MTTIKQNNNIPVENTIYTAYQHQQPMQPRIQDNTKQKPWFWYVILVECLFGIFSNASCFIMSIKYTEIIMVTIPLSILGLFGSVLMIISLYVKTAKKTIAIVGTVMLCIGLFSAYIFIVSDLDMDMIAMMTISYAFGVALYFVPFGFYIRTLFIQK